MLSMTTLAVLVMVALLLGMATMLTVRPLRNMLDQTLANQRAGLGLDPEVRRRARALNVRRWLIFGAQVTLACVAVFGRPSTVGWIAIAIVFVLTAVARYLNERARFRLLTRGLK